MRVLYKEPGKAPEVKDIDNTLEALQGLVQGWIEHIELRENRLGLIINEEGRLHGMDVNFYMPRTGTIVGPAVFVGESGEEFTDILHEDAEVLKIFFSEVAR